MLKLFICGIPVMIVLFIIYLVIDNEIEKGWVTWKEGEKLKKVNTVLLKICKIVTLILFVLAIANLIMINTAKNGYFAVASERTLANVFLIVYIITNLLWGITLFTEKIEAHFMFERTILIALWLLTVIASVATIFAGLFMLIGDHRETGNIREEKVETIEIVALTDHLTLNISGGRYYIGTTPEIAYIYIPESDDGSIEQKVLDGSSNSVKVFPNSAGEPRIEKYESFKEYIDMWGDVYEKSAGYRYVIYIPNDLQYVFNLDSQ